MKRGRIKDEWMMIDRTSVYIYIYYNNSYGFSVFYKRGMIRDLCCGFVGPGFSSSTS